MIGSTVRHVATQRVGEVVAQNRDDHRLVVRWDTATAEDAEGQRLVTSGEQTQHTMGRSDIMPVESKKPAVIATRKTPAKKKSRR